MVPKVVALTTGEQIICGITELKGEDGEGLCFVVAHPYVVQIIPTQDKNEEGQPTSFNINYLRFMACSSDTQFRIPYTSVMTIGEPEKEILETYMSKFGELFNDTTNGGDAGDTGTSDSSNSAEESGVSDSAD